MYRDETTLQDIAEAARLAAGFVQGLGKAAFLDDLKTQSAVLYQLIVMGEAVKRLSAEFRQQHPETPWALIAGMRDNLIHGYDLVDWDEVWKTATSDVVALLAQIEPLLRDKSQQPS
ncbi:DUF86 domain-containing protein [candidate division TA06 bacterium]|uniref:DUF86 domain-containing protein n=1 Tax=candidate division TA06 bacterium TaxID=2250710 RepID=A0A933MKV8_UNCT6|nr:DUF86 domain-containing protein [candidate division TA06 bacterium]